MAMLKAKQMRKAFERFIKEHGRPPNYQEAAILLSGDNRKKQKGFTLIKLMVIIAVFVILAVIVISRFQ